MATAQHGAPGGVARDDRSFGQDVKRDARKGISAIGAFWTKIMNDWILNLAGLLAYNFLMSSFPILLVILAIGGFLLDKASPGSQAQLQNGIGSAVPGGANLLINVQHTLGHSAGLLLIVGIVVAIFTGSSLFMTLENCMGVVFKLRGRDPIHQRLMAVGMLLLYVVLIPIILLASVLPATIVRVLPIGTNNPFAGFLIQAAGDIFSVIVAALLFGAIYVVVPNRPVEVKEVWKGTLVAAVLLVLYETVFPIYVAYFLHPGNYGSTAAFAVVLLLFFYYLGLIVMLGAEVNSWALGQRETAGDIVAILHEVQAHNTTRGAAGPTAGMPQEDVKSHKGASAMRDAEAAIAHERDDHKDDAKPPKYAASGVVPPGYNIEGKADGHDISVPEAERIASQQDSRHNDDTRGNAPRGDNPRGNARQPEMRARRDTGRASEPAEQNEQHPGGSALAYVAPSHEVSAHVPATRPLTLSQRRALGAVVATSAVALAPLLRWCVNFFRDEPQRAAD